MSTTDVMTPITTEAATIGERIIALKRDLMRADCTLHPNCIERNQAGTLHVNVCSLIRELREFRGELERVHGFRR